MYMTYLPGQRLTLKTFAKHHTNKKYKTEGFFLYKVPKRIKILSYVYSLKQEQFKELKAKEEGKNDKKFNLLYYLQEMVESDQTHNNNNNKNK